MKNLRQFCAAIVFTLALTFSAFAGDIQAPGAMTQSPLQPPATGEIARCGVAFTGDSACSGAVTFTPLTEITLKMLQSMLFYF
jgi:hypothetical protein